LRPNDNVLLFESGKPALDEWFRRYAKLAASSGTAKTFVTCNKGGEIAGFYSIATGQVSHVDASERVAKGVGRHAIPVIVLARLAVDLKYQGMGIGHGLLQDCVSRVVKLQEQVGVRALVTHAKDEEAAGFYARFGFEQSPVNERQMMVLMKDLRQFFN
jgi:predicted N-acetyltransferase YhbS